MNPPSKNKRRDHDTPISPPPLKRRLQSTTTTSAVSSFFTPVSKKPKIAEKLTWEERAENDHTAKSLLIGRYLPTRDVSIVETLKRNKIAAFDFDSTLIETASGKKFASEAQDWKWWHPSVPATLKRLHEENYRIVVVSNQGGISLKADSKAPKAKITTFKAKVAAVFDQLELPISIYAATAKDIFRKPRTGMWTEFLKDYDIYGPGEFDLEHSIFVGDAAGRHALSKKVPKDFSCSDRNFAENVGLKFYTPEEYFLGEDPRQFTRAFEPSAYLGADSEGASPVYTQANDCDIVLFCGSPGAGKSTFYWKHLEPLGYQRINQDTLKTREKCLKAAQQHLENGQSVAIDNTNADADVRGKWIELAAKHSVPIRCVLFTATHEVCEHNDVVRALNNGMNPEKREILPTIAFAMFKSKFVAPKPEDFQDITEVSFKFSGTEAERKIWTRYWT